MSPPAERGRRHALTFITREAQGGSGGGARVWSGGGGGLELSVFPGVTDRFPRCLALPIRGWLLEFACCSPSRVRLVLGTGSLCAVIRGR